MTESVWRDAFLRLAPGVALKRLEDPCLYHVVRDELYELDETALAFLARCDGTKRGRELTSDGDFVTYCLAEGLLDALKLPERTPVAIGRGESPSLRYLELRQSLADLISPERSLRSATEAGRGATEPEESWTSAMTAVRIVRRSPSPNRSRAGLST